MAEKDEIQFYAAGYHLTPFRLAIQVMVALVGVFLALALLIGGAYGWMETDSLLWLLLWLGSALLVVGAWSMLSDIGRVRKTLWHELELRHNVDIDGDGHVGPPPRPVVRTVLINGDEPEVMGVEVPLEGEEGAPVLEDFGLTAEDVRELVFLAKQAGSLSRSVLVPAGRKFKLGSGTRVTRGVYDGWMEGMRKWHWVEQDGAGWRFRVNARVMLAALDRIEAAAGQAGRSRAGGQHHAWMPAREGR